ncbi:D-alanyl-D-alanine carboxypeptidase [Patescibacteria group bacterium]|nr:MAG: D-alanyl-D-alanine carboxypeptidase [Patescibacteria group bacterium]
MTEMTDDTNTTEIRRQTPTSSKLIYLGLSLLLSLSLIVLVSRESSRSLSSSRDRASTAQRNPFETLTLQARAALVWDIKNQKALFEKDPGAVLPFASLTKVLVALTALDLIPDTTVITLDKSFLAEEGDVGLFVDERWTLRDLVDVSLVSSSNDAATAIAAVAGAIEANATSYDVGRGRFIELMNKKALEIGMMETRIFKESGLDAGSGQDGAYGSARDIARLFEFVLQHRPDILSATKYAAVKNVSINRLPHTLKNTNPAVDALPAVLASKTGFTDGSGGNLAVVIDPAIGRPLVVVVLGSGYDERFSDVAAIAEAAERWVASGR